MKKAALWILIAALIAVALCVIRASRTGLNVAPDAQREIDKAKRR